MSYIVLTCQLTNMVIHLLICTMNCITMCSERLWRFIDAGGGGGLDISLTEIFFFARLICSCIVLKRQKKI